MSNFELQKQAAEYELPVSTDGQPISLRDVADPVAARTALYDNVLTTMSSLPPVESQTHRLRLEGVKYVDDDADQDDEEQSAMDTRSTLGRRIRGTWVLESKADGAELDRKEQILGVVPKITNSGALIFNGSKYAVGTQHRINPGFFNRRKKSGELESLANVARGTGARHRYLMDPETGLFSFNIQNSKIPISNVLEILGATKEDLETAWGKELADINWSKRDPKATQKLFENLAPKQALSVVSDDEGKRLAIKQAFEKMVTDAEVNSRTTGLSTDKVDKDSILAATRRVLELHRGDIEADDRDHASFQSYHGPEDVFAERVKLDAGKVRRELLYKAQRSNSLKSLSSRPIDRQFQSALLDSGLAQLVDAPNPLDLIDRMTRVTVYGEGGIGSQDSTPDSTRYTNHTYTGFIDPLRTVESGKVGADTFLASGARKGSDGQIYTPVVDMRTGKRRYASAKEMFGKVITETFKPDMNESHIGIKNGKISYFEPEEIDFVIEDPEGSYNNLSNLVPGKSAMVPHRTGMATRMLAQSVELVGREAPLLQNGVRGSEGQTSYEMLYGEKLGAKFAPDKPGTVISVTPKHIEYLTADGEKGTVKLSTETVLGRKSRLHNTPLVRPGDRFTPHQLLASSNFTDDRGVAAIGTNLRVVDMSYPDAYEDAYVVSESAAKNKLASVAMYQNRLEADPTITRGLNPYVSVYAGKFDAPQLKKLGNDGVIKVGQKVSKGDPMILAMERLQTVERVHKKGRESFKDVSVLWDHDDDGEVVGVYQDKTGNTNVRVKTVNSLKDGDKLAMRNGLKGIVVIKPDSEMPRDKNGVPFEAIAPRLGVISRKNPIVKAEIALSKIARKRGDAYRLPDFGEIDDLRDYVRDELAKYQVDEKEDVVDPMSGRTIPKLLTGEAYFTKLHHYAESKVQGRATGRYTCFDDKTDVLTKRGWVPWPEVLDQDIFATLVGNKITYQEPTNITREFYDGQLCGFSGKYVDYLVTPNHRMWVRRDARSSGNRTTANWAFVPASELPKRVTGYVARQAGFIPDTQNSSKTFTLYAPPRSSPGRKVYSDTEFDYGDYAELVGWYLSEGTLSTGKGNEYSVYIFQVEHANPDNWVRIKSLLSRMGINFSYVKPRKKDPERGRRGFRFRSKAWWYHLKEMGAYCHNKRIPRHLMDSNVEVRTRLLESLILGDGTETEYSTYTTSKYCSSSIGLADDVQELALRVGLGASVSIGKPTDWIPGRLASYVVGVYNTRVDAAIREQRRSTARFYETDYLGMVYCATVPAGLLITRRNGKVLVTGNSDGLPSKGGDELGKSKRIGLLAQHALLAGGGHEFVRGTGIVRGQANSEFWQAFMRGDTPPTPKVPERYTKFMNLLKVAGVNPLRRGTTTTLMPMTDTEIKRLAGERVVRSGETVDLYKDQKPIPGGLMDPRIFGEGDRPARMILSESLPNPAYEPAIKKLLNLKGQEYRDLIAGKHELPGHGVGMKGLMHYLKTFDVDAELTKARADIKGPLKTKRDLAVKRLGFIKAMKNLDIKPTDLLRNEVFVLPPRMRPIAVMGSGKKQVPLVNDLNYLYRELFDADENLKNLKSQLGEDSIGEERLATYDALSALGGQSESANPELQKKGVKGALRMLLPGGPKESFLQRKLIGNTADAAGRGVVRPSHKLGMDEVGLPKPMAWDMFANHVVRDLVRRGMPVLQARESVVNKTKHAQEALERVMEKTPVLVTRDPALHQFNTIGQWPKLVEGNSIQSNALINKGMTLDHDGDTMSIHVPITKGEIDNLKNRLMPSKMLLSPADFKSPMYAPNQDFMLGISLASIKRNNRRTPKVFMTEADAKRAIDRGEIDWHDPVKILKE